jgi:hypothetical protein
VGVLGRTVWPGTVSRERMHETMQNPFFKKKTLTGLAKTCG